VRILKDRRAVTTSRSARTDGAIILNGVTPMERTESVRDQVLTMTPPSMLPLAVTRPTV